MYLYFGFAGKIRNVSSSSVVGIGIVHLCVRTFSQKQTEGGRAFGVSFYLFQGSRVGGLGALAGSRVSVTFFGRNKRGKNSSL